MSQGLDRIKPLRFTGKAVSAGDFVSCARSFVGTPYIHRGRKKGVACDCVGLIIQTGWELGIMEGDITDYSPAPTKRRAETKGDLHMKVVWDRELQPVADATWVPGRVALFWYANRREPQHYAILGRHPLSDQAGEDIPTIIHAHSEVEKVVEARLVAFWEKRLVKLYELPGVNFE